jgi:PAS domain S-box-containing protein
MPIHVECKCEEFYGGKQNELISNSTVFHIFGGYYKHQSYELRFGQFTFTCIYDFVGMENKPNYTSKNKPVVNLVWQKDINGIYLWCNEEFGIHVEKSPAIVAGLIDYDLFPEKYAEKYILDDLKVIESGISFEFEESTEKDGNSIWWRTRKFPVRDQNGIIIGVLGEAEDITWIKNAKNRLNESEDRFRKMFYKAPLAYQSLDLNGCFIEVNDTWLDMMGYTRNEIIGKWFGDFLSPEQVEPYNKRFPLFKIRGSVSTELRLLKKDSTFVDVAVEGRIGYANNGDFQQTHCILIDISEQKRYVDALKSSEAKYRAFFENSFDAILLTSTDGKIYSANHAACQMFEMTEEQIIKAGRSGLADITDPQLPIFIENRNKFGKVKGELSLFRGNGSKFIGEVSSNVFCDPDGIERTIMIIRDMTERRKMEEKIEESGQQLNTLINNIPGFVYQCLNDRNWTMLYLSHRFTDITGYNPHDVINNKILSYNDIIHPDDREWLFEKWAEALNNNKEFEGEYRIVTQTGETRWVWERGRNIKDNGDKLTYIDGIVIDITERKNALESMYENDARFKRLSENAEDIIFRFDLFPSPHLSYINPAVERITGFTPEECYSNQDITISNLHPDDIPFMLRMVSSGEIPEKPFTLRWQHKNGTWHWLESKVVPVYDKTGTLIAVEGITRDITEKKNIDDLIASERILLRTIIDTVPDALYVKDMQGNKILANKAEMKILNVNSIEEYYGKPDTEFYTQEAGAKYWADDLEVLNSQKPKLNIQELVIDQNGREWWLLASKVPLFDKDGNLQGLVGVGRDITERKKLQDELEIYKTHLEVLVKERTLELEEKNKELQRMNDIFVGREFRIKELKDRIKQLETELGRKI